jgi:hypothetical protein
MQPELALTGLDQTGPNFAWQVKQRLAAANIDVIGELIAMAAGDTEPDAKRLRLFLLFFRCLERAKPPAAPQEVELTAHQVAAQLIDKPRDQLTYSERVSILEKTHPHISPHQRHLKAKLACALAREKAQKAAERAAYLKKREAEREAAAG